MGVLTAKRQRFVDEYLIDLNGAQAAIRAGYATGSAKVTAARLLTDDNVAQAITLGQAKIQERTGVTQARVIQELAAIAFSDTRKLYDDKGNLRPVNELEDDAAAALAGIESEEIYAGRGEERTSLGVSRKVKRWDKTKALELLGKHLGIFVDKHELTGKDGGPLQVNIIDPTRRGPA